MSGNMTNTANFKVHKLRGPALGLVFVWGGVLAITCWFAYGVCIGSSFRIPNTWQLLFISALFAPVFAYYLLNPLIMKTDPRSIDFVNLNIGQLKTYLIGVVLTMLVIGMAVILVAAVWGFMLNCFLLTSDILREKRLIY